MSWIFLWLAGAVEILFALSLKMNQGFTRLDWSAVTAISGMLSFWLLATAIREIPIGTAYAVWTGMGAVGTALLGIIYFEEPRTVWRLVCLMLIVIGLVGLKISSSSGE